MTPGDLSDAIQGWNEAQGGGEPEAPTADEYAALVATYA